LCTIAISPNGAASLESVAPWLNSSCFQIKSLGM